MKIVRHLLLLLLGTFLGVAAIVYVDVQRSLALIDPADSSTWPNMAPQIRYYFVPMLVAHCLVVAAVVEPLLRYVVVRRTLARWHQWLLLGLGYSLLHIDLPMDGLLPYPASRLFGLALAVICALLLRVLGGRRIAPMSPVAERSR
jgi:hypothetical protein